MNKLEVLEGIGPKTKEQFHRLKIDTIEDLIEYYPRDYQIIRKSNLKDIQDGNIIITDGIVEKQPTIVSLNSHLKKITFRITNQESIFNVTLYNQVFLAKQLKIGIPITIIGKYERRKNNINVSEIRNGLLNNQTRIEPIYPSTSDLNRKTIAKFIMIALRKNIEIKDNIPKNIIEKYNFPDKLWSIKQIHQPTSTKYYNKALQRLKYEELYTYLSKIQNIKKRRLNEEKKIPKKFSITKVNKLIKELPFNLTKDQEKTIEEIENDMKSQIRMNRLIQGDVGSGKTIIAFLASYMNYLAGYQTAFMVPTEILATQHYQNAIDLFKNIDINIVLLTSNTKNKKQIYSDIENGKIDLIIGTQALIQEKLKYNNLGLIITDEQHRFGVHQRENLKNKGIIPDILSMSATPIPRTYALTIYGDMDISNIKTKPKGRKEVITTLKKEKEIYDILTSIKQELDKNHQIYIIVPQVEETSEKNLNNITTLEEKMNLAFSKIATIGVVHGNLPPEEKNKVMKNFEKGQIDILISTTVIEVGVNVPNASMIVIFQANYFGLSTLHQLRGRVGRSDIQSYCILISKKEEPRLKILEQSTDGFKISEYDFKTRGEGDLFGIRQSGYAEFKLADLKKDFELLLRVKEDIDKYLDE